MAIESNNSEEVVAGGGYQLYTGIAAVSVVAVNPTQSELQAIGINAKEDPKYNVEINGEEYNKVVFYLRHEEPNVTVRFDVLMQPSPRVSKAGDKAMWINNVGQMTWSGDVPAYDWWKNSESSRKAYVGEDTLVNFTKAWANVANGGKISFDTIGAIAKGDVKELKELVKALSANKLRVLIGVKDEKYQVVYNRHFGRLKPANDMLFVKALNEDYGSFNAEYSKDLKFGVYSPTLITADTTSEETPFKDDSKDEWDA
jgi:hypothetical protein